MLFLGISGQPQTKGRVICLSVNLPLVCRYLIAYYWINACYKYAYTQMKNDQTNVKVNIQGYMIIPLNNIRWNLLAKTILQI